jgi:hypothetical protein
MHLETGIAQNTLPNVEREEARCPMVGLDPDDRCYPLLASALVRLWCPLKQGMIGVGLNE